MTDATKVSTRGYRDLFPFTVALVATSAFAALVGCDSGVSKPSPSSPEVPEQPPLPASFSTVSVRELDPKPRSGTRLVARVVEFASATIGIDFWDTKLNVSCAFAAAADGEFRCLPIPGAVGYRGCGTKGLRFVRDEFSVNDARGVCLDEPRFKVYEAPHFPHPNCNELGSLFDSSALEPIDPLLFARGVRVYEYTGNRLGLDVIWSEDGARDPIAVYDHDAKSDCSTEDAPLLLENEGVVACTPDSSVHTKLFADSNCTDEQFFADLVPECRPFVTALVDGQDLLSVSSYAESSAFGLVSSNAHGDQCRRLPLHQYPGDQPFTRFDPGAERRAVAQVKRALIGDRLRIWSLFDNETELLPLYRHHPLAGERWGRSTQILSHALVAFNALDAETNELCTPVRMPNDKWYCAGQEPTVIASPQVYFADDQCTEPLDAIAPPPDGSEVIGPALLGQDGEDGIARFTPVTVQPRTEHSVYVRSNEAYRECWNESSFIQLYSKRAPDPARVIPLKSL